MTPKKALEIYGKEMLEKMDKTGYLDGITVTRLPNGDIDIPESDLDRAFRAVKKLPIGDFD